MSSQPLHVLTLQSIKCRNLRSADFLSKNDVYVTFRCGEKRCKTKYLSRCGKNPEFEEVLTLELTEAELGAGVEVEAMDYDFGPDPDDLLGVGWLKGLTCLVRAPGHRLFKTRLLYKGKHRGELEAVLSLATSGRPRPPPYAEVVAARAAESCDESASPEPARSPDVAAAPAWKRFLGLANPGAACLVPAVALTYALAFAAHRFLLVAWAESTLVPLATALTGVGDAERLSWCCVFACLGIQVASFEVSMTYTAAVQERGYDAFTPRRNPARVDDPLGARLYGAHANASEDLGPFGLAVSAACVLGADARYVAALATLHVLYRLLHWASYAANVPPARSTAFIFALATTALIFAAAVFEYRVDA